MAVLEIVRHPDKVLRQKAKEIPEITPEIKQLGSDMLRTMYENQGCGLAGPQVGERKRMIVVDVGKGPIILVNPVIERRGSKKDTTEEGCLSIPGVLVKVKRPEEVEIRGIRLPEAKEVLVRASGIFAVALQHEIDHLDGKLIIDRMGAFEKWKLRNILRHGCRQF